MAVKTEKAKKSATKKSTFDAAEKVSKSASKKKVVDDDDDLDEEEEVDDDWGKADEDDDSWDPDFDEFDIPKSKTPKKAGKGKKGVGVLGRSQCGFKLVEADRRASRRTR